MLFAFLSIFSSVSSFAQDNWKVCIDQKVLLNTTVEDEEKNTIKISAVELKKIKLFVVSYKDESPQTGWERTILVYDEKDNEKLRKVNTKLSLKIAELNTLLGKSKTIKVYTMYAPIDPKMKAQVRLRRVHLCTLILQ